MNNINSCGNCPFYKNGWCKLLGETTDENDHCNYVAAYEFMSPGRAVKVLHAYQKYSRGNGKMPMPQVIGYAIDEAIRCLRKEIRK